MTYHFAPQLKNLRGPFFGPGHKSIWEGGKPILVSHFLCFVCFCLVLFDFVRLFALLCFEGRVGGETGEGGAQIPHFLLQGGDSVSSCIYHHGMSPEETPPLISAYFFLPKCLGKTSFKRAREGARKEACEGARRRAHEGARAGTIKGAPKGAFDVCKTSHQTNH